MTPADRMPAHRTDARFPITRTARIGRAALVALVALAAAASLAAPAAAQNCTAPYFVEQSFPTGGPEATRWRICWQAMKKYGLVITSAHFRTSPTSPWIRVFWDARVAEIFVPYHDNSDRFFDVTGFNWNWRRLTAADCPAAVGGTLLGAAPGNNDICKEVRDRGIAWRHKNKVRRGEELVLWGVIAASNYDYITEWTFRDDGVILGRVGATGPNYPGHPLIAHTHDATWRLDVDLNGWAGDSVEIGTHTETGATATDLAGLINNEQSLSWDPQAFTTLHIRDAGLKNGRGSPSMYHLMALRWGNSRHQEPFTQQDFWVTLWNPLELEPPKLPQYINPAQPVANADIVVWHTSGLHHLVRDEDGKLNGRTWNGMAQTMWVGFMMKPHNLFDGPPLWP
jgi:primary-amine oxidase